MFQEEIWPVATINNCVASVGPTGLRPPLSWQTIRRLLLSTLRDPSRLTQRRPPCLCPICNYSGAFISVGHPPRPNARCPNCGSRERHRLAHLWATEGGGNRLARKRILHFAPEKAVQRQMRGNMLYETVDLHQEGVTYRLDITCLALPDMRYDVVMAHHVLEHIEDDRAAIREIFRVLAPGGLAILSVPINPSRQQTYENPGIRDPADREAHFSAPDHRRYYGLDFADRLAEAGFKAETFRMSPHLEPGFGLLRTEWLYIARKAE